MAYEFQSRVRFSETDESGVLSLGGLIDYFQDCSTFQSEDLGVGVDWLKRQDQAWILSAWQILMDDLPSLGEAIRVQTWAYAFQSFYGLRNFQLLDAQGRSLARANSVWVLYDMKAGRPVRVSPEHASLYQAEAPLEMDYAPRKIAVPEGGEMCPGVRVERAHLDTNHHVNNGKYLQMAQDCLPEGFAYRQVRAEYRRQAFLGDVLHPRLILEKEQATVVLSDEAGRPCAIAAFHR